MGWAEVPGHPGLLYCMAQASNNPVVLMVTPDAITLQEVKVTPAKAKVSLPSPHLCETIQVTDSLIKYFTTFIG